MDSLAAWSDTSGAGNRSSGSCCKQVIERTKKKYGTGLPEFVLFVCLELWSQAFLLWQVDTIIYSSVQGHFTDWQIRLRARRVGDSGCLGTISAAGAVFTRHCFWAVPPQRPAGPFWIQWELKGENGNKEETWGRGGEGIWAGGEEGVGAVDELSPLKEEGRAEGYDWLQTGQSSRPRPEPQPARTQQTKKYSFFFFYQWQKITLFIIYLRFHVKRGPTTYFYC